MCDQQKKMELCEVHQLARAAAAVAARFYFFVFFFFLIMIQSMPAYLRMLRRAKPVQTAVKGCQNADRELQGLP